MKGCIVCKNKRVRLLFKKKDHEILKCKKCGLIYVGENADQEILNEKYNKNEISPFQYYKDNKGEDYNSFSQRIAKIEKYHEPGKLLDLGCSIGTFLTAAIERGWEGEGLDVNKHSVSYARKLGLNVVEGFFSDGLFPKAYYDTIVMNDFLEHTINPDETIRIASKLLKKNGILYIVTPNSGSIVARLFGRRWLHLKPDEHLYYFSPHSIKLLLDRQGMKVKCINSRGRIRNAKILAEKMESYSTLASKIFNMIPEKILSKIRINVNPGDEMEIIAVKE